MSDPKAGKFPGSETTLDRRTFPEAHKARQAAEAEAQKAQQAAEAEAQRKAQQAGEAEAQRKAQQAGEAEAQRKAQQTGEAEAQRKAQQTGEAEAQRKAQQAGEAEAQQVADVEVPDQQEYEQEFLLSIARLTATIPSGEDTTGLFALFKNQTTVSKDKT
jgi:hypothetical protein